MKRLKRSLALCACAVVLPLWAADPAVNRGVETAVSVSEFEQLKRLLIDQQRQIDELRQQLAQQQIAMSSPAFSSLGQVASAVAVVPRALPAPTALPLPQAASSPTRPAATPSNPCEAAADTAVPAYLRLGSVCLIPVGFMDLTAVWRDKNAGSSIGTNFGSVPYNNTVAGKLSEFRFSPQNSRLGFRADGDWKGTHFIGYNEFDFLSSATATSSGVTNGAFVPRLRLFWVDARKGKLEFLAGQSWSMLTPNRSGISAIPGNIFFSQVIDVNYMAGLTWTRQPGLRVLYHASNKLTLGLSLENPNQYAGGSAGGPKITPPSALAGFLGTQLDDTSGSALGTPNVHPDIIVKVAFDPSSRFHFDVAGIERTFKTYNSATDQHFTAVGAGAQFGFNAEIVKNLRLVSTNYWSNGGGRYLFGQAPDVILRSDGSISPIHSGGTVDGFEATVKNWLFYAYYGNIYIGRNAALDANGTTKIGYGYAGSPNSQNRSINEFSFGFNQTLWRNARYGAINFMGQYEYLIRNPWFVALGAPKAAHDNTLYFNVRYTLPGAMPNF